MIFESKTVGNCLTQNKIVHFEEYAKRFDTFISVSQFHKKINHISECDNYRTLTEAKLFTGEVLYGITRNGYTVELGSIIDSSD